MASLHTINYFKQFSDEFEGPYLEIGSLIQEAYAQHSPKDIKNIEGEEYIGLDIFPGEGVDLVFNLATAELSDIEHWKGKFGTVHAHYVFEHVTDIFKLARNIDYILKPGGKLCFSAPFCWRLHRIPIDMWRFTPQSVDWLFPTLNFDEDHSAWSSRSKYIYPINQVVELSFGSTMSEYSLLFRLLLKLMRKLKLDDKFFQERALIPELNLMMIGTKTETINYTFIPQELV